MQKCTPNTFTTLDAATFLKSKAQHEDFTHLSFKGAADPLSKHKGKWKILPDEYDLLFRSIETLSGEARSNSESEFPYVIERKREIHRFVQDVDITGALDEYHWTQMLGAFAAVLRGIYPGHELECTVFDSSGQIVKDGVEKARTSLHVCWNLGVNEQRSLAIYTEILETFTRGDGMLSVHRKLLELDPSNEWPKVLDRSVHKRGTGMRMPFCDKWSKEAKMRANRPAMPVGKFTFTDGPERLSTEGMTDRAWIESGSLNMVETLTEPCHLTVRTPSTSTPKSSEPASPTVPVEALSAIKCKYPGVEIATTRRDGNAVRLNPIKNEASRTCPLAGRQHASNNVFFVYYPNGGSLYLKCWDGECKGKSVCLQESSWAVGACGADGPGGTAAPEHAGGHHGDRTPGPTPGLHGVATGGGVAEAAAAAALGKICRATPSNRSLGTRGACRAPLAIKKRKSRTVRTAAMSIGPGSGITRRARGPTP